MQHLQAGGKKDDFQIPQQQISQSSYFDDVVSNTPQSIANLFTDAIYPFLNPVETAKSMKDLGVGVYSLMTDGGEPEEAVAEAIGEYFKERYGSVEAFQNSFRTDPAGVVSDVAGIVTGGALLAAKGASKTAKVAAKAGKDQMAQKAQAVSNALQKTSEFASSGDPLTAIPKASIDLLNYIGGDRLASGAGNVTAEILGRTTGVGPDAISEAFTASRAGGDTRKAYFEALRNPNRLETAQLAKNSALQIRREASGLYTRQKAALGLNEIDYDYGGVRKKIKELKERENLMGKKGLPRGALEPEAKDEIKAILAEVGKTVGNPADRNLGGLDDAIVKLNATYGGLKTGAAKTYHQELKQAMLAEMRGKVGDGYDQVLVPYHETRTLLDQFDTELKVNPSGERNLNQMYRGLLRSLRSNVNTNFGESANLLRQLDAADPSAPITARIAGETLTPGMPSGLLGTTTALSSNVLTAMNAPQILPLTIAASSPRLVGEAVGAAGAASGILGRANPSALQNAARASRQVGILGQEAGMARQDIEDQNSPYQQFLKSIR
jgi:hypothetical protein